MRIHKQKIIKSQGQAVVVYDRLNNTQETKALIGRASKQSNSTLSMEAHRKGMFTSYVEIQSGYVVKYVAANEYFIVVATLREVINDVFTATITHMMECNCILTVKREVEVGDDNGNICKVEADVVTNVRCYVETLKEDLKQYDVGVSQSNKYAIYAPSFELLLLDKISIVAGGVTLKLKLDSVDYLSYPGIALLKGCSETRK